VVVAAVVVDVVPGVVVAVLCDEVEDTVRCPGEEHDASNSAGARRRVVRRRAVGRVPRMQPSMAWRGRPAFVRARVLYLPVTVRPW
jgi:hypothetical protein